VSGEVTTERLLLCRPLGGLNDMLCQIELACRYAERFGRTVIVDTHHQSERYFRDSFSNYFVSRQNNLVLNDDVIRERLDAFDVFPKFLAGRVSRYKMRFEWNVYGFIDEDTDLPVSFDFNTDYAEPLLVHHASGGGEFSLDALARMRLQDGLLEVLLRRLEQIGPRYSGIHVRNTDYKAKYKHLIGRADIEPNDPIFLATDNRDTVAYCRSIFGPERLFSFAGLPAEAGAEAHYIDNAGEAYERNRDAIVDLVMLALASRLYLFELAPNPHGAKYSGFTVLAANLHNAKPVLKRLISDDEAVLAAVGLADG
jgi:hypothetical protein